MGILSAIEDTGIGVWVRESGSLWSYPTIIFLHSLGMSFVVGMNAVLALRLLGCAPDLPLKPMERLFPIMWWGFWVNAASGVALLIADAATMLISPVFYIKMAFIAAALVNMVAIKRHIFGHPRPDAVRFPPKGKFLAAMSLVFWAGAITAGRLTAYLGPAVGLKGR